MQDHLQYPDNDASSEVHRIALRTLGILAREKVDAERPPLISYLEQIQQAVQSPDRSELEAVIQQMRTAMISPAEIAERYVPLVARSLGACWVEDTLDFRTVSIGSARLQSLLWQLEEDMAFDRQSIPMLPEHILVAVPQGCQHTLGATVLTGQLRRYGLNVQLELETTPASLTSILQTKGFSAIMISASSREKLEILTELVQTARQSQATTPVLIGGNINDLMQDITKITGADLVTCDVAEALTYCGLERVMRPASPIMDAG